MKTAVSIPDEIFRSAEKLAKTLHVTRSELYARALQELLKRQREDEITEQLNKLYAEEDSSLDPAFAAAQRRRFRSEKW